MARDITIRYVGDSRSAERAARNVGHANDRMQRSFGGVSQAMHRLRQAAVVGFAAAGVLAVKFGVDSVKAFEEANKIGKQTTAVITSTGMAAKVSTDDVEALSTALSKKAGIDDEVIRSGANVLLTFTKVRNEVGKGNDIFSQATATALDMSVALGQDMQSSVIQLGKALNDPIRGITALRRVGVTFSEGQVDMIKKLVETGDLLGAQKIILQELTTEFGGSAAAQATASGRLSVAWGNLQETMGEKLLPVVEAFSTWLQDKGIPLIEDFADWIGNEAVPAVKDLGQWVKDNVVPPLATMGSTLQDTVIPALSSATSWIADKLAPAFETLNGLLGQNSDATDTNKASWQGWAVAIAAVAAAVGIIAGVLAPLIGVLKIVAVTFGFLGFAATTAFALIVRTLPFAHIASLALIFRDQIVGAFRAIRDGVVAAWQWTSNQLSAIWAGITSRWTTNWQALKTTATTAWEGIKSIVSNAWRWVSDQLAAVWGGIKRRWSENWQGLLRTARSAWDSITSAVRTGVNAVIGVINGLISGVNWVLNKLGIPKIGTIPKWSSPRAPVAGGTAGGTRPTGFATGGVLPLGQAGPFMTNGPMAVVGEGNRAYPEYVIPTDPKFRGRALGLFGQLGHQLVPGMAIGGILGGIGDAFKGGFDWAKDRIGDIAGGVFRKALELGFSPFNTAAKAALNAAPNPFSVRDIAQGLRETVWQWVKGADSALPTKPPPGAGSRPRGSGLFGLHEPVASMAAKTLALGGNGIWIVSGWRSRAQQAVLYNRWLAGVPGQARAAPPGSSKHEAGLAVDWGGAVGTYQRIWRSLNGHFPVRGEYWHGEAIGYKNGTNYVPRDGLYGLHRGEAVIPAASNKAGATVHFHMTFNGPTNDRQVVEALKREVRANGPLPIKVLG